MEKLNRKPFQGTFNIIRFNWHFYVIALLLIILLQLPAFRTGLLKFIGPGNLQRVVVTTANIISILVLVLIFISLAVSAYIYDLSGLYTLRWINTSPDPRRIINIHAGFDETSALIRKKFPASELRVFDFYDPAKHTEVSVKRARKAYPSFPGTMAVGTEDLQIGQSTSDLVLLLFSAHEIRGKEERIRFFSQLKDGLTDDGRILVAEHLRDIPNFLAYSFGFFHFFPKKTWTECFLKAGFEHCHAKKINPFITLYTLQKNGNSY